LAKAEQVAKDARVTIRVAPVTTNGKREERPVGGDPVATRVTVEVEDGLISRIQQG